MTKVVKMSLKSEFTLFQNSLLLIYLSHVIPLVLSNLWLHPWQNMKLGSFTSWLCKDGKKNVQKRMIYMQSCCFANTNLQCIALCRSCCHGRHHCLRFLINSEKYVFICRTSRNIEMYWKGGWEGGGWMFVT